MTAKKTTMKKKIYIRPQQRTVKVAPQNPLLKVSQTEDLRLMFITIGGDFGAGDEML